VTRRGFPSFPSFPSSSFGNAHPPTTYRNLTPRPGVWVASREECIRRNIFLSILRASIGHYLYLRNYNPYWKRIEAV
jgi:hypothetical protein